MARILACAIKSGAIPLYVGVLIGFVALSGRTAFARGMRLLEAQPQGQAARSAQLSDALARAEGENRVLLVCFDINGPSTKKNAQMFQSLPMKVWASQYALTVNVTDRKVIEDLSKAGLRQVAGEAPLMFVAGKFVALPPRDSLVKPASELKELTRSGSLALALRLHLAATSVRAKELGFTLPRARLDPKLKEESMGKLISSLSGPGLEAFTPGPDQSVFDVLSLARTSAAASPAKALGMYIWLWEQGAQSNEHFDAARLSTFAQELFGFAQKHPLAKPWLDKLRQREAWKLDLGDGASIHEYLILCRVVDDFEHNFLAADLLLNNRPASLMMSEDFRRLWEIMLPRAHFNDPTINVTDMVKVPAEMLALAQRLDQKAQELPKDGNAGGTAGAAKSDPKVDSRGGPMTATYLRWLAPREVSRRYAWQLIKSDGKAGNSKATETFERYLLVDNRDVVRAMMEASARARPALVPDKPAK
jgi:hypothetical protein